MPAVATMGVLMGSSRLRRGALQTADHAHVVIERLLARSKWFALLMCLGRRATLVKLDVVILLPQ